MLKFISRYYCVLPKKNPNQNVIHNYFLQIPRFFVQPVHYRFLFQVINMIITLFTKQSVLKS